MNDKWKMKWKNWEITHKKYLIFNDININLIFNKNENILENKI